jgi:hypothetical protein
MILFIFEVNDMKTQGCFKPFWEKAPGEYFFDWKILFNIFGNMRNF